MSPRIMIIDDGQDQLKLMSIVIGMVNPNAKVSTASSGVEALQLLKDGNHPLPQLILLDLRMPGKNGIEVLSEIKADLQLRHIPVCTFSNGDLEEDVRMAYLKGASFYFRKPAGLDELQKFIQYLMGLWWEFGVMGNA